MSFNSDFGDMLPHTVYVSQKIGVDSYNMPVYGIPTGYQARVVFGFKLVRNRMGEMVPASGTIWLSSRFIFKEEDKYTFVSDTEPSPEQTTQLFPLRIDTFPDENGFYYTKVYFQ